MFLYLTQEFFTLFLSITSYSLIMLEYSLEFLSDLNKNNNRDWFEQNRSRYARAKSEFEVFVNELIIGVKKIDPNIGLPSVKDCIFRIYRDTRFSHDKTPYKSHFSAYIADGGRKSAQAGYYFHLEPEGAGFLDGTICAGGLHCPEAESLRLLREDIVYNYKEFKSIIEGKDFTERFRWFDAPALKKVPRGFSSDFEGAEWLKMKELSFFSSLSVSDLSSKGLLDKILEIFSSMYPLNTFINRAIEPGNG